MTLKEQIIYLLQKNKGSFISGQDIAEKCGVSRSAVAKCISSLKKEGFIINSVNNLGHCLDEKSDILSSSGIKTYIFDEDVEIFVFDIIDSTNNEAKRMTAGGFSKNAIIAANGQTEGRGRRGKSFFSPHGVGLYFSVILHPNVKLEDATGVTAAAAVAVAETISETTKKVPKIKWVNDIFIENKKVCGILTEAVTDFETMNVSSVIIGIGLNITTDDFPDELKEIASSIGTTLDRCELIGRIYHKIKNLCDQLPDKRFMDDYRSFSLVTGKNVKFEKNGVFYSGIAKNILDDGSLLISLEDGQSLILNSGEISIKL